VDITMLKGARKVKNIEEEIKELGSNFAIMDCLEIIVKHIAKIENELEKQKSAQ